MQVLSAHGWRFDKIAFLTPHAQFHDVARYFTPEEKAYW